MRESKRNIERVTDAEIVAIVRRGGGRLTTQQVARLTGISHSCALARLKRCEQIEPNKKTTGNVWQVRESVTS